MKNKVLRQQIAAPSPQNLHLSENILDAYQFIEAIVEAVHEPIIILDAQFKIVSVNKALLKNFKLTRKYVLGRDLDSLIDTNPKIKELIARLKTLTAKNTAIDAFEITFSFTKIGERTLLINAKRIILGKFATDFLLLGIEDITKRKLIEQQKDDFVGYVTHELKTPITTVVAFVQILQAYLAKGGDKKSQFLLGKVDSQMKRLTNILNAFGNVYKAQSGTLNLHKKRFDMRVLIQEVAEGFSYMSGTHTIAIIGETSRPVLADRERMHEVLSNLIMNAIKYSPHADKVKIKISETKTDLVVSVKDYGMGITRDEQQKVFERFFRVKGKMEHKIEGLGLGLYLVAAIIKAHKGKVWVESTEGKGSIFSFSLPL